MSTETVRHESTYMILFLTRHNESMNDTKMTSFTHRPRVSLAWCSFCWWRHNRLLMTSQRQDNCYAITWTVISNSLDIDIIHDDLHGRSCLNVCLARCHLLWWRITTYSIVSVWSNGTNATTWLLFCWILRNVCSILRPNCNQCA